MKLIITIPKDKYCYIQELEQDNTDYATTRMLYHAVKHGKPYLEQEQKTGRWIASHIPESMLCECSECEFTCGAYSFNYCPNCGCAMKGELE